MPTATLRLYRHGSDLKICRRCAGREPGVLLSPYPPQAGKTILTMALGFTPHEGIGQTRLPHLFSVV